jgi:sugar porter (SP) family MFS transporter
MSRMTNSIKPTRNRRMAITVAILAGLGGFLFGYDTGVISGAILFINEEFGLSSVEQEIVISILLLFAGVGALIAGRITDRFGRRKVILWDALLFVLGAIILACAPGLPALILGRIIVGLAIGVASMTVPLFVAELSPSTMRGLCVSMNQLLITVGIVVAYGVDFAFSTTPEGWRWMLGLAALPACGLFIGMLFLPETPRWLIEVGRVSEGGAVLERMGYTEEERNDITEQVQRHVSEQREGFRGLLRPEVRLPLIIGMGLALFQQITGINTIIYYAPTIFQMSGVGSASASILATVGVGVVNVLTTIVALFLLDRVGRKPLLIIGISGMIFGLLFVGLAWLLPHATLSVERLISLSLMIYIAGFAIGLGPIAWLIIAEIYPLKVRGVAMGLSTLVNWISNFVVALTFLSLINLIGQTATFWSFALLSVCSLIFVIKVVPETKGKSLEQLEAGWKS